MTIGEIIENYIKEKGISIRAFAEKAGLSHTYVSLLLKNVDPRSNKPISVTIPTLKKIATAMKMDINYLFSIMNDDQLVTINTDDVNYDDIIENIANKENGQQLLECISTLTDNEIQKLLKLTEIIKDDLK